MCQIVRLDCQMQNELPCVAVLHCGSVLYCTRYTCASVVLCKCSNVCYCTIVAVCAIVQLCHCVLFCNCATVCYCALLCQMQQIFLPARASTKFILDPVLLLQYLSMFIQPQLSPFKADLSKYL